MIASDVPNFVLGDPNKLKQILINLIGNSIKFTEKGEIFIEVRVSENKEENFIISFSITDTGIGMSKDFIKKMFKPFVQADNSSTRKYGGTGLGLVICKSIIDAMGGKIDVKSQIGDGTIFSILIPLQRIKMEEEKIILDYSKIKDKTVLVVDDNDTNRKIVKLYLEEEGCNIIQFNNAYDAINKFLQENFSCDVVLIDYNMPQMNGHEMAKALKKIESSKNIPLILLTSKSMMGDAKAAKESGFNGYLSKPYTKNELMDCILMVLQGKQKEDKFVTRYTAFEAHFNNKLKILLVEDNEVNKKLFIKQLQHKGLTCDIASNGEEAIMAFLNTKYDIIFMDCQMPILDGYEATIQIRQIENELKSVRTPIVAMTAYAMIEDVAKCKEVGMDDYLSKPVSYDELLSIIKNYTEK